MVNLNRLHYFFICAQAKQVTRAAELLGISQPSLSQQLKVFEEELGFDLFVRTGRAFELTPKGKNLYAKSIDLFKHAENILSFVTEKTEILPTYKILVADQIDRPFIAEIVGKLLKTRKEPAKYFQVISRSQHLIQEDARSVEFDLIITNSKLKKQIPLEIFELPVNLITSKKHNVIQAISERNLKGIFSTLGEHLVMPSAELNLRETIDRYLKEHNIDVPIIFESNILSCTIRAIRDGVGCGFLPIPYIREDAKRNLLSIVGPPSGYWQHPIYFYNNLKTDESIPRKLGQIMRDYF